MKQEDLNQQGFNHQDEHPLLNAVAPGEIIIGVLVGMNEQGQALVNFQESTFSGPVVAISTVALNQQQAGRQVALLFAEGNPQKPVIMGLIHSPLDAMLESFEMVLNGSSAADENLQSTEQSSTEQETVESAKLEINQSESSQVDDVYLDGQRIVLEGKEEIVFKCGDASITLTKAGKILIRGKYLLNRSTGVNRIMGGSVQVN
ncbi:MAG: DUF6484 domain-containing protein [Gammaproteobacteria bacterium]|nr:DUF6484 domain-containing protein [Gammaproteobacteria bacterium]